MKPNRPRCRDDARTLLDDVREWEHRFAVYRSGGETDVEDRFPTHNVSIDYRKLPSGGPEPFLVIADDTVFTAMERRWKR